MEICIPLNKARTSIFLWHKKTTKKKNGKKGGWVNINREEINNMFDIIEDIAEEDLT